MKDQKILSIMAAKRADEVNHDKIAAEAHRQWEAERSQQLRTAWDHEQQRQLTLAQKRQQQEQHRVRSSVVLTGAAQGAFFCRSDTIFSVMILCVDILDVQSVSQAIKSGICKVSPKQKFSLKGASYKYACTKSQFLRPDLNCSRLDSMDEHVDLSLASVDYFDFRRALL